MRRIRYQVATSLDGYIAGPQGEIDWIVDDPDVDFAALYRQFDTALMGRATYEAMVQMGHAELPGIEVVVFSRTLNPQPHPNVTVVAEHAETFVAGLKARPGKDIWLFGGGVLFQSLAAAGLVNTVEVAIMPAILGGGIPLSGPPATRTNLRFTRHKIYTSGIVLLEYTVI